MTMGGKQMLKMPVGLYEKALPPELSWEERLGAAGQAGYDFIDISIDESDGRLSRLDWSAAERAALRRAIANTGVQVSTMCLSAHRKYPFGSKDPAIRRQGHEIMYKAIDFAVDIGLRVVQVMAYDVFYEPSDEETRANFIDGLALHPESDQQPPDLGIGGLTGHHLPHHVRHVLTTEVVLRHQPGQRLLDIHMIALTVRENCATGRGHAR